MCWPVPSSCSRRGGVHVARICRPRGIDGGQDIVRNILIALALVSAMAFPSAWLIRRLRTPPMLSVEALRQQLDGGRSSNCLTSAPPPTSTAVGSHPGCTRWHAAGGILLARLSGSTRSNSPPGVTAPIGARRRRSRYLAKAVSATYARHQGHDRLARTRLAGRAHTHDRP